MTTKKTTKTTKKEAVNNTASSLVYSGNVTIKLTKNGKTLKSFKRHNVGCIPLFDFLTRCLTNAYNGNDCPKYLLGFHSDSGTISEGTLGTPAFTGGPITYQSVDQSTSKNKTTYKTTYKFIIPSTLIDTTVIIDNKKLNVLAIYSTTNRNSTTSPSAYISLPENKQIGIADLGVGISIIVLWEMTLTDKSLVVNN